MKSFVEEGYSENLYITEYITKQVTRLSLRVEFAECVMSM